MYLVLANDYTAITFKTRTHILFFVTRKAFNRRTSLESALTLLQREPLSTVDNIRAMPDLYTFYWDDFLRNQGTT